MEGHRRVFLFMAMNWASTFFLAQGVLRRNFKLELTEGSLVKHLILMS